MTEVINTDSEPNPLGELSLTDEKLLVDNFSPINDTKDFANSLHSSRAEQRLDKVSRALGRIANVKLRYIVASVTMVGLAYLSLHHDNKSDEPVIVRHTPEQIERQCATSIPNIHEMDPAQVMVAVKNCADRNSHPLLAQNNSN